MLDTVRTGISAIGDIPWGSHFCHFYDTANDLADVLVPFFQAGLANNERCVWVTAQPFQAEAARAALAESVSDLAPRMAAGQIQILDYSDFYLRGGRQDAESVLADWVARKEQALADGYSGLRVSGNTFWIESRNEWDSFAAYEAKVSECFHQHRIVALCSYHLGKCTAADTVDMVSRHDFALFRERGEWRMIESARHRQTKQALQRANEDLERRVAERTAELRNSERRLRELFGALPIAVYTVDVEGRINSYNDAAVRLWGRRPAESDRWCGSLRLFMPDGTPINLEAAPIAIAMREWRQVTGAEAVIERPDGSRVVCTLYPMPLFDPEGNVVGAVNILVDITERKAADERRQLLMNELNHRVKNTLASVLSIAGQTFRGEHRNAAYRWFEDRLLALSEAQDVLTAGEWRGAALREIAMRATAPMQSALPGTVPGDIAPRIALTGPAVDLRPNLAVSLALVLHELCTNAAKYGALSNGEGRVDLTWETIAAADGTRLHLTWRESGGPPVTPPTKKGFGSRLIEQGIGAEFRARVQMRYAPAGLVCELDIPLERQATPLPAAAPIAPGTPAAANTDTPRPQAIAAD